MAKDLIHEAVKRALENDGWKVIDDPFYLSTGGIGILVDLGVEKMITAEMNAKKILVEIKTFSLGIALHHFYRPFGQYVFYRDALADEAIEVTLYLAMSLSAYRRFKKIPFWNKRIAQYNIKIIVVNITEEKIVEWKA